MKVINMLDGNEGAKTNARKKVLFHVLLVAMVICGSLSLTTANAAYPILNLDIGRGHNEAEIQEGFNAFTVNDSGTVIDGIMVEIEPTIEGEPIQVRWRGGPTGIPYEQLYRDFIFTVNGGLRFTLSGLEPNKTYEIKIYSWDQSSAEYHIADWSANGEFCLTTNWTNTDLPTEEDDYAFSGNATADDSGTIVLEATDNPETSNPGQYYCFVNALVVSSLTPLTTARDPVPEDGALVQTTEVELQWEPGLTSISSDVYFGESFDDVNDATTNTDIFRGNVTDNTFIVGAPDTPYPDGLVEKKTYYWRIDSVEAGGLTYKGNIWSFTVAPKTAFNPVPVDGSLYIDPDVTVSWLPGAGSIEHHVFFGDSLEDVMAGTGDTDKGTTTEPNYTPGTLGFEKTYYWRVDEFDGTETHTGDLWSFTTTGPENGTVIMDFWENVNGDHTLVNLLDDPRYPDNPSRSEALTEFGTVNGAGDNYGAQISGWLYCPVSGDYTFWLSCAGQGELWLSTDDDPANIVLLASESNWGTYDSFTIKSVPIELVAGSRYYIMVRWKDFGSWDHCQVAWRGPGIRDMEIIQGSFLSPFAPIEAYGPNPVDGSVDVRVDPVLTWNAGKHAASHVVYFGTDPDALSQVATTQLGDESYVPASQLQFNTTYYWRVDEVNDINPDSPWTGLLWSFTTGNHLVVEDFEDYNDYPPDEVWNTWIDGYENPMNGSTAGYPDPDFVIGEHYMETTIVHGGRQSMPLFYDNATGLSEVTRTLEGTDRNWTRDGVVTLTMWYYGDTANAAEQMFVALNGNAVVINTDAAAALVAEWTRWDISLQEFADQGANLANISSMSIGFGNKANPLAGGSGVVFFDDVRLYR